MIRRDNIIFGNKLTLVYNQNEFQQQRNPKSQIKVTPNFNYYNQYKLINT